MPTKIILDCDPGHDDAIAMMLAAGNPGIDLLAVTTVAGNQSLEKVTRNALGIATVAGIRNVPIAAGMHRPLVRPLAVAESIHGESGLDGPRMPEAAVSLDPRHAVDVIIETIMGEPAGEVTLVPTGPLTNIAIAVRKEPRIVSRVRQVVLMGGGHGIGNWSATAEFNIVVDPEAAHIVFNEPWPLTMVGLNATHQALATPDVVAAIGAIGTPAAEFVTDALEFYGRAYAADQGFEHPPVHDPCAVAYVIDPSILTVHRAPLDVELTGTHTLGMTVADFRASAADSTSQVAVAVDNDKLWRLIVAAIAALPSAGNERATPMK